MSLSTLLSIWRDTPGIVENITAWRTFPAQPGQFAPFPIGLHPALVAGLQARGIEALYTHQASAWQQVQAGQHPVIATGTASGKTLCYNLPILDRLLRTPKPAPSTFSHQSPGPRSGRVAASTCCRN